MENKNKELINVFTEDFWNKHNMGAYEKYFTTDFVAHYADGDYNFEQYKGICQAYFTAFPDLHITANDLLAVDFLLRPGSDSGCPPGPAD